MRRFGKRGKISPPVWIALMLYIVATLCFTLIALDLKGRKRSYESLTIWHLGPHFVRQGLGKMQQTWSHYVLLATQIKQLKEENKKLWASFQENIQLRLALETLQRLGKMYLHSQKPSLIGSVSASYDPFFFHHTLLNLGKKQNVHVGDAVVDERGLVGRILQVGQSTSSVLLVSDLLSRTPVYVGPHFEEAILVGNSTQTPFLLFKNEHCILKKDDLVVTSGVGGILDKGILVGVVETIEQRARVRLFAQLNALHEVRVFLKNA